MFRCIPTAFVIYVRAGFEIASDWSYDVCLLSFITGNLYSSFSWSSWQILFFGVFVALVIDVRIRFETRCNWSWGILSLPITTINLFSCNGPISRPGLFPWVSIAFVAYVRIWFHIDTNLFAAMRTLFIVTVDLYSCNVRRLHYTSFAPTVGGLDLGVMPLITLREDTTKHVYGHSMKVRSGKFFRFVKEKWGQAFVPVL
jgi:hypothetical protein